MKYRTQNIEVAKYRIAKYRQTKYPMQNIERKISKWQNIERQNSESPADLFLSELEIRGKTSCCLSQDDKAKQMVCKFKVLGQPVTSEVRSLAQITKSRFRGRLMTDEAVFLSIGVKIS